MAIIQSGASADLLTVDPTSKALRASQYGPDGAPLVYASLLDRAIANIRVLASAASTICSVWALRNTSASRILYITSLLLQGGFNGTGAATEQQWEVTKFTGVTALAGGAVVTPFMKRTSIGAPDVDARVLDTGLTVTGGVITNPAWSFWVPRLTHSATQAGNFLSPVQVVDDPQKPIELAFQEAIAIRSLKTQVIGDILEGGIEFYGG
jgi:hypothetical protein